MNLVLILLAGGTMLVLALVMAYVLGWANRAWHVKIDPRIEQVNAALPGANCGACGYIGCGEYAEAVVVKGEEVNKCPVGGESVAREIAEILGVDLVQSAPYRPVVHCGATTSQRLGRNEYRGEGSCAAANLIQGVQGCTYGCLGLGDCVASCKFDAIHVVDGLATVDYHKCTGCGACAKVCPRNIISLVPFKSEQMLVIACSNHDFGKEVKGVCEVGCLGCKACARFSELLTVEDNLPRIDYEAYDPNDASQAEAVDKAFEKCPMKRLLYMGKPSERDLAAVADEQAPAIVSDDFKTTVDETEWRG
jgi:Na+-translocating ferredoxin:NAD+ oxidoreductase RNF subunit RnfB